jgi:preprotein translocase subunit SecG
MMTVLIIVHVTMSLSLIMIVLLQSGKGAEMGAAFGGSSQTVFGGAGAAPFLSRVTTAAAVIFMLTSLALAYISAKPFEGSIMDDVQTIPPAAMNIPAQAPPVATQPVDAGNAVVPVPVEQPAAE